MLAFTYFETGPLIFGLSKSFFEGACDGLHEPVPARFKVRFLKSLVSPVVWTMRNVYSRVVNIVSSVSRKFVPNKVTASAVTL